ncbi:sulfatase maturation enzyme AslB (radical SAM superfamily) [Clostridiales Family XIII bacterium PM5-7]
MTKGKFINDEKKLMESYIDSELLPLPIDKNSMHISKNMLELIVRPECNQKCEYCYIYKYGTELYPTRSNKEETLKNIDMILDYVYMTRKNFFYQIEIFAGDLFYDDIYFDMLDIFEKYFGVLKKRYGYLFSRRVAMVTPCNMSFVVESPEKADRFIEYHNRFLKDYNVKLAFSWSTDGIYSTDIREKAELNEEYFDTIFEFCKSIESGYHPMISAYGIDNLKDNYDWWLSKLEQFDLSKGHDFQPPMLEVRNGDEWTDEAIDKYLDFLSYAMEKRFELCNYSVDALAQHFFDYDSDAELKRMNNYDFLIVDVKNPDSQRTEAISCSMQHTIHFNCTNLSLSVCHRTTYPEFTGAYFKTDETNSRIVDIEPHNVSGYITLRCMDISKGPMCVDCEIQNNCLHGCIGAQYEYSGEIMLPIPSVCNLFKKKVKHLVKLYNEYGLIDSAIKNNYLQGYGKEFWLEKSKELGYEYA